MKVIAANPPPKAFLPHNARFRACQRPHRSVLVRFGSERAEALISGEWETTWSLATYDDVMRFFSDNLIKPSHRPSSQLRDVMQEAVQCAHPSDKLSNIKDALGRFSGLPVIRRDGSLIGVIARRDLEKPGAVVADVMSYPPIAALTTETVSSAACLMLKYKIHRLPIVDSNKKCVGIVTRTDIFKALAMDGGNEEVLNIDY